MQSPSDRPMTARRFPPTQAQPELLLDIVDMHTGGEPVRILRGGAPAVRGGDILAKRRDATVRLDHIRRFLMLEPRGHYDMYGAWLVEPTLEGADLAVLFMHNAGFSTMCGHATIALARYAIDEGIVPVTGSRTRVGLECPCGLVEAWVDTTRGWAGGVAFDSVPAFVERQGLAVQLPGLGEVVCDLAYGGAYYAIVEDHRLGLSLSRDGAAAVVERAGALTELIRATVPIVHPAHVDLGFLYGTIVTDGHDGSGGRATRNLCVFADRELDRSPTGSGVTARMALYSNQGSLKSGEERRFESVTGAVFSAWVTDVDRLHREGSVIVRVAGEAYYMGQSRLCLEVADEIGRGFLVR